jgi:hypothetical protein
VDGAPDEAQARRPMERFDIQYCKIEGLRAELFDRLLAALKIQQPKDRETE